MGDPVPKQRVVSRLVCVSFESFFIGARLSRVGSEVVGEVAYSHIRSYVVTWVMSYCSGGDRLHMSRELGYD